jgi:EPS-associated MarR family transcriptional regulator
MKPNHNPTKLSAINLQVLSRLQDEPRVSQRGLASDLGVSLGGVNYCLKALISKGFVKAENFSKSSNKLGYAYLLTASGIREKTKLTSLFLKRKRAEYSRLEQEIAELEAQLAQELADKAEAGV